MYGCSAETNCSACASGNGRERDEDLAEAHAGPVHVPHGPAGDAMEVGDLVRTRERAELLVAQRELLLDEPVDREPPRRRIERRHRRSRRSRSASRAARAGRAPRRRRARGDAAPDRPSPGDRRQPAEERGEEKPAAVPLRTESRPSVRIFAAGGEWIVHFLLSVAHVAASTRLTLIAAILGSSIVFIDGTVVNVALPPIQHDLGGGLAAQQWIVDAYLLTLGSLILVGGSLGDIFGEVRVFRLGVGVVRPRVRALRASRRTCDTLIVFRGLQGIAGALLTPASLAVITSTFSGTERGAAIGTWTAVERHLDGDRAVARRLADRDLELAGDLLPECPDRDRDARDLRAHGRTTRRGARACASTTSAPRSAWSASARSCSASSSSRSAAGTSLIIASLLGGAAAIAAFVVWETARAAADAAAAPLPPAELQRHEHRDVLRLRRALGVLLLPRRLPAAERRLLPVPRRPRDAAGDAVMFVLSPYAGRYSMRSGRASSWRSGR